MSWIPAFVLLILLTTTIDFFAARRIDGLSDLRQRRLWLLASVGSNFGVLFGFKSRRRSRWDPVFTSVLDAS